MREGYTLFAASTNAGVFLASAKVAAGKVLRRGVEEEVRNRDDDCRRILRACRSAIPSDGTLLLGEQILEPDPAHGRPTGYLIDMQMMAMFGQARERTEAEFRELLDQSGFALTQVVPTRSPVSVIEAKPIVTKS